MTKEELIESRQTQNDGMEWSKEQLRDVFKKILDLPREQQAMYCDETVLYFMDEESSIKQMANDAVSAAKNVASFRVFDSTVIGNFAMLSLCSPKVYANKFETILVAYTKWAKVNIKNMN